MFLIFGFLFFIFFEIGSVLFLWFLLSKQLLDQEEVDVVHPLDKEKGITLEDFKHIKMHMANCILSLSLLLGCIQFLIYGFFFDGFDLGFSSFKSSLSKLPQVL